MKKNERIHFIGIGGISMSGLAEIAIKNGYDVTGSDMKESHLIDKLRHMGAKITVPHSADSVTGSDLVVYTAAIKMDNPEILQAKALGIPMLERANYLGDLMKSYPYGIAISGTHGKTTTTSMTGIVFREAVLDPTILVGGEVSALGGNVVTGSSKYFIMEACEYVESFLKFYPFVGVILNIEADHLDYFRDLDHIKESFLKFTQLIPADGAVIVSADCPHSLEVGQKSGKRLITFGLSSSADYSVKDLAYDKNGFGSYLLTYKGEVLCPVALSVPGKHNVQNSLAVLATAILAGISPEKAAAAISSFRGTSRRFEQIGMEKGVRVIDEYAHHPTEIKAAIQAAVNLEHNKIWVVFQPHTYTRTRTLFSEFSTAFSGADSVFITDIYAAREKDPGNVSVSALAEKIAESGVNCRYCGDFEEITDEICAKAQPGDLVFAMGAGDVNKMAPMLLEKLKRSL